MDGREKANRKYRTIAVIGPVVVALMLVPILLSPARMAFKINCALVGSMIGAASDYHVKHLLIPDVDYGVVRCLRGFNALTAALSVMGMCELIALAWEMDALLIGSGIGLCAVTLALAPVMDRG